MSSDFLSNPFDSGSIPESEHRAPRVISEGMHPVIITACEGKETKAGGQRISVSLQIIAGEFENCKLFDNQNVKNNSPKAQEIGRQSFRDMLESVGAKLDNSRPVGDQLADLVGLDGWVFVKQKALNEKGFMEYSLYWRTEERKSTPARPAVPRTAPAQTAYAATPRPVVQRDNQEPPF